MELYGERNDMSSFLTLVGTVLCYSNCQGRDEDVEKELSFTISPVTVKIRQTFNMTCALAERIVGRMVIKNKTATGYEEIVRGDWDVDNGAARVIITDKRIRAAGNILIGRSISAIYRIAIPSDNGEYWCIAHWLNDDKKQQIGNRSVNITVAEDFENNTGIILGSSVGAVVLLLAYAAVVYLEVVKPKPSQELQGNRAGSFSSGPAKPGSPEKQSPSAQAKPLAAQAQPDTSTMQSKPSTSTLQSKPSTSTLQSKPSTSTLQSDTSTGHDLTEQSDESDKSHSGVGDGSATKLNISPSSSTDAENE